MRYIIGAKWSFFEKMHFFCKIFLKSLPVQKKCVSLHRQTKTRVWYSKIGIWCNGKTTDSGPVIPGSSPGIPTRSFSIEGLFFSPKYPNVSASFRNRVLSWLFFYIRKGNKDWFFNLRSLFWLSYSCSFRTEIFCFISSISCFRFSTLRLMPEISELPFFDDRVRKPRLFSYCFISLIFCWRLRSSL